jgi:hypothetical protein
MNGRTLLVAGVAAVCLVLAGGCAPAEDDEAIGSAGSAAVVVNSLNAAALDATASYPDALTPGMLSGAALQYAALSAAAQAAIEDPSASGTLSRQLLSYTVGCALGPTQSFVYSWTDAWNNTSAESYPGILGLATDWGDGPIDPSEQPWISACLIGRVNYYGIHVSLSSRGSDPALVTSPEEVSDYTYEEGAFWGDVFSDSPTAYACDYVPDATHSEEAWRVCATGVDQYGNPVSCGIMQQLGSCDALCAGLTGSPGQYYPSCSVDPGDATTLTSEVITVFLQ